MNLVIDIGNTLSKVALFEKDRLVDLKVATNLSSLQIDQFIKNRLVQQFIIASVRDDGTTLYHHLSSRWNGFMMNFDTPIPFSLAGYQDETLGVDRIALLAAASHFYPKQNSLIIACGSCITYNYLDAENVYKGGGISPGIHMRLAAMHAFTGKLPSVKWSAQELPSLNGFSTTDAMLSGAVNGAISEVEGVINRYRKTLNSQLNIILTGGDANFFEKELKNSIFAHANFVLYGLNEILQFNS
jgi:type III pantothenate kinase